MTGLTAFFSKNKKPIGNTTAIPVRTAKRGIVCKRVENGVRYGWVGGAEGGLGAGYEMSESMSAEVVPQPPPSIPSPTTKEIIIPSKLTSVAPQTKHNPMMIPNTLVNHKAKNPASVAFFFRNNGEKIQLQTNSKHPLQNTTNR